MKPWNAMNALHYYFAKLNSTGASYLHLISISTFFYSLSQSY